MEHLKAPLGTLKHLFRIHRVVPPEPFTDSGNGQITIGEVHTQLLHAIDETDRSLQFYLQSEGEIYPNVSAPESHDQNVEHFAFEKSIPPTGINAVIQNTIDWMNEVLATDTSEKYPYRYNKVPAQIDEEARKAVVSDSVVGYIRNSLKELSYFLRLQKRQLYVKLPWSLRHPADSRGVAFAWHKYKAKFAVALKNNTIHIYDLISRSWSPVVLSHEIQRDIQCIEWKPLSGNTLAVGTRYGCCVWEIMSSTASSTAFDPLSVQAQDQTAWMRYLQYPNHTPVNAMAWCPKGRFLATGSINSGEVVVWDYASGQPTPLFEVLAAGVVVLRWSANGNLLMAGSAGGSVRIWESYSWTSEKWVDFPSFPQSAAWSSGGQASLLAVAVQSTLHFFQFPNRSNDMPNAQGISVGSIDFSTYAAETKLGVDLDLCGRIQHIVWDPTSYRIAVSFFDSPLIAIMSCRLDVVSKSVFDLQPIGFIQGPKDCGFPVSIAFRENHKTSRGALLGVLWQSGRISFYPLYFNANLLQTRQ